MLTLQILAEKILKENLSCALSGSLALNIQYIKTKRPPGDIDIYLPFNEKFNPIDGMIENYDFNRDDYLNDEWNRVQYIINGVKVDVFTPREPDKCVNLLVISHSGIKVVRFDDIIKFKIFFAFNEHSSAQKHKDDVLFIIENSNKQQYIDL